MAFDLRAPVPIRFQRYISNTPVWEAGELYLPGDIVKYIPFGGDITTDPTDTLYIALVNPLANTGAGNSPSLSNTFWKAAAAGDVTLGDIILPADPLDADDGQAFRIAIGGDYVADISTLQTFDTDQLVINAAKLDKTLGNILDSTDTTTAYATVSAGDQDAFKTALAIQGSADAVIDADIILEGIAPSNVSTVTVSHIIVNGLAHPLGGSTDEVPAGIFAYNFDKSTAVAGSDDDDTAPADLSSVLRITTAAPHLINTASVMISAPAGDTLGAFDSGVVNAVVAADGLSAVIMQDLMTADVRNYTFMVTVNYSTSGDVVVTPSLSTQEVSITAASVVGGSFSLAPSSFIQGGPNGAPVGTINYTGGFGCEADQVIVDTSPDGFSGIPVVTTVGDSIGRNRADTADIYSSFSVAGLVADASAINAGRPLIATNVNLFNPTELVTASSFALTSNDVVITEPPLSLVGYHGWVNMKYDASGSGDGVNGGAVTAANALLQFDLTVPTYETSQQIMTDPTGIETGDISYMIAIPVSSMGTNLRAVINIGGQQVVEVTQMLTAGMTFPAVAGVSRMTGYNIWLVKADESYDALDRVNVQTLIVE